METYGSEPAGPQTVRGGNLDPSGCVVTSPARLTVRSYWMLGPESRQVDCDRSVEVSSLRVVSGEIDPTLSCNDRPNTVVSVLYLLTFLEVLTDTCSVAR